MSIPPKRALLSPSSLTHVAKWGIPSSSFHGFKRRPMGRKVLIVEDLPEIRNLLREAILEPLGFDVLEAETIKEAWALFQTHRNDLAGILMDGELPETTDELVRKISAL